MNMEKFTERSRGFLQAAQMIAMRENHQRMVPEHLLKALLDDEEGVAVFNEDGTPSEATQRVSDLLVDLMAKDVATDQFIDYLVEQNLLHATASSSFKLPDKYHSNSFIR